MNSKRSVKIIKFNFVTYQQLLMDFLIKLENLFWCLFDLFSQNMGWGLVRNVCAFIRGILLKGLKF